MEVETIIPKSGPKRLNLPQGRGAQGEVIKWACYSKKAADH